MEPNGCFHLQSTLKSHKLGTLGFAHTCYQMEVDQTALPRRRAEIVPAPRRKDIFLKKGKGIQLFEVEQAFKIWELGLKYVVILLNWMY